MKFKGNIFNVTLIAIEGFAPTLTEPTITIEEINEEKLTREKNGKIYDAEKPLIFFKILIGIAIVTGIVALITLLAKGWPTFIITALLCLSSITGLILIRKSVSKKVNEIESHYSKLIKILNSKKYINLVAKLDKYSLPKLTEDEEKEEKQKLHIKEEELKLISEDEDLFTNTEKEELDANSSTEVENEKIKISKKAKPKPEDEGLFTNTEKEELDANSSTEIKTEKTKISKNKKPKSLGIKIIKIFAFITLGALVLTAGGFGVKELIKAIEINNMIKISRNGDEVIITDFDYDIAKKYYISEITIPSEVTSIGGAAFANPSSIGYNSITINFGQNSNLKTIEELAFSQSPITEINLPDSLEIIEEHAFESNHGLNNLIIPDGVTSIGYGAFQNCTRLTNVVISNNITKIEDFTFFNCNSLSSVEIPNGVESIGGYAFEECSSLINIELPNSITNIGNFAFYNCSSLTSITIPDSVTSIGAGAFCDCDNLENITIPNSVTSIGRATFAGCNNLESITIPFIGQYADGTGATHFGYIFGADYYSLQEDYVPSSLKEVIITGETSISDFAFYECDSLTSITIPDSVTSIGYNAFNSCNSLETITFEENSQLLSIGSGAFEECYNLENIIIPSGVTNIGSDAFSNCSSLTIYCEASSEPNGWNSSWNFSNRPVYWAGEWKYDANGNPTPII